MKNGYLQGRKTKLCPLHCRYKSTLGDANTAPLIENPPVCKGPTKRDNLQKVAPREEVFTCQAADFSVDPGAAFKGRTGPY